MTRRPPTAAAVAASPPTTATADVRSKSSGSFTVAAFLLVATTAVLADVIIRVGEYNKKYRIFPCSFVVYDDIGWSPVVVVIRGLRRRFRGRRTGVRRSAST